MNHFYKLFEHLPVASSIHRLNIDNPLESSIEFLNDTYKKQFSKSDSSHTILRSLEPWNELNINPNEFKDLLNRLPILIGNISILPLSNEYFVCQYNKAETLETFISSKEFLNFIESIPCILFQFEVLPTGEWKPLYANSKLKDIFGESIVSSYDLRNEIYKHIHKDDYDRFTQAITNSVRDLSQFDLKYRITTEKGENYWIHNRAKPEKRDDGSILFSGVQTDITDQKGLETKLTDRDEPYHLLFEKSNDAIILNTIEGRILSANPAAERMYGGTEAEIRELRSPMLFNNQEIVKEAIDVRNTTGKYKGELEFISKNGNIIPVEVSSALYTNSKGDKLSSLFIHDISNRKAIEKELQTRESLFRTTLSTLNEGVILTDKDKVISYVNPKILVMLGQAYDAFIGHSLSDFYALQKDSTKHIIKSQIEQVLLSHEPSKKRESIMLKRFDDKEIPIQLWAAPILENSELKGLIIIARDLTLETEQAMQIEGFLNVNLDMLCVTDLDGNFIRVNHRFEDVLGYSTKELEGLSYLSLIHPDDLENTKKAIEALSTRESINGFTNRYLCKDGRYKYLEWVSQPGYGNYVYASAHDITDQIENQTRLHRLATRDELTGLRNRHALESDIESLLQLSNRYDEELSTIMFDLDHFKSVNDTYGHDAGDEVLKTLARESEKILRTSDYLYRVGGEEFLILLPKTNLIGAEIVAEKLRFAIESVDFPIVHKLTISLGVVEHLQSESLRQLMIRADKALYEAKNQGRNKVVTHQANKTQRTKMIEWHDEFNCGVSELDLQHQTLIQKGNELIELNGINAPKDQIDEILNQLYGLIESHFIYENTYLKVIAYPDAQSHAQIHSELLSKLRKYMKFYQSNKLSTSTYFSHIIDDIILNHMLEEDRKFFSYIPKSN